ncbi:glycosyltransferase family 2 protein [Chloroflexi bacterium TSY]|nr:glycosyltransferase family 2 protein [Chloroflexi bacterium TSY]
MVEQRCTDLMYLAWNRLEFTKETFSNLLTNTDWEYVHELFVYDDGSHDGTGEWLAEKAKEAPVPMRFVKTDFGSPVAAMVHFIESAQAPILAKMDNDAMLPPAWLRQSLDVLDQHPELSLLGIEAIYPHNDDPQHLRSYRPAQFISGLGLYRRAAFSHSRPRPMRKWHGLEEWQLAQGLGLKRGWIAPALPVFLLDRIPFDPWRMYSDQYIKYGWQRSWPKYDPTCTLWHWRWPPKRQNGNYLDTGRSNDSMGSATSPFKVVILSANASNLIPCVRSILANEPTLPPDHIIVVDDGARSDAEAHLPSIHWVPGVKPFIFARNANIGIDTADEDVILLNDDARLVTPNGFSKLAKQVKSRPEIGICSAGIRGCVGNQRQLVSSDRQLRIESKTLAFICAYIPKMVREQLGPFDERFVGYGFEDNDYCARTITAGWQLAIWDGCIVDHSGELPSTFRSQVEIQRLFKQNQDLFQQKWGRNA